MIKFRFPQLLGGKHMGYFTWGTTTWGSKVRYQVVFRHQEKTGWSVFVAAFL